MTWVGISAFAVSALEAIGIGGAAAGAGAGTAALGTGAAALGTTAALGEAAALGGAALGTGATALGTGAGLGAGSLASMAGPAIGSLGELGSAIGAIPGIGGLGLGEGIGAGGALTSMAPGLSLGATEGAGALGAMAPSMSFLPTGDIFAAAGAQNFSVPELLHGSMINGWQSMANPSTTGSSMMPAPTGAPTQALPGAATPRPDLAQLSGIDKLLQQYSQPDQVVSALVGGQKMLMQNRQIKAQEMAGNRASSSAPSLRSNGGNAIPVKLGGAGPKRPSPLEAYALLLRGAGR